MRCKPKMRPLDQAERSTIETMMADQPDPFAHVTTPEAAPEAVPSAASDESDELDEKEALVQKLEQNKAELRKRKAQASASAPSAESNADEEDERSALVRKLKAGRAQRNSEKPQRTEPQAKPSSQAPAELSTQTTVETQPNADDSEAARLASSIIAGRRAKAQEPEHPSTGDAELDALSAALIAETERVAAVPLADNKANVASVAQAIVSALSAEEKEQLKNDSAYQQDLARDIAAALAEQTQDDQVDLRSLQTEAVATPAYSSPTQAIAQNTTPSGAPRAPMMPLRRRGARRQAAQAALNPDPIGGVEAVGSYGAESIAPVPDVPEGFGAVPTAPMRPLGGPAVRPSANATGAPAMAAPGMAAPGMAALSGMAEPEYYGAAPSAAALLARGPQSSGRGLNAMLSPNPNMGADPMGAPVDSKLSQALAQMGQVAGRGAAGGFKAKDLARASMNPGLNFSAGTAMNPGMADMLGAPLGMGTIDGPFTGGMGYEDDDPTAVLNEVVNNGLNSVAPLTQEQLDTLNQLQAGLAAPEPQRQHYANYQARNAYGIKR